MMGLVVVGTAALAGALLGWSVVPWVSNSLLKRVRHRADAWWNESIKEYWEFKRTHPHQEPDSAARGLEGAVGIWREDALGRARAGLLTPSQVYGLQEVGFSVSEAKACKASEQQNSCYSFEPTIYQRLGLSVLVGLGCGAAAYLSSTGVGGMALFACVFAMATMVVCDLRARCIPLEACAVLAGAGAVFQFSVGGMEGVLLGLMYALVVVGGCSLVNGLMKGQHPQNAVGAGDVRCMGALALATGPGAVCGLVVCYALAALVSLGGCLAKKLTLKSGMPMAPFLATWLIGGAAVSLMAV